MAISASADERRNDIIREAAALFNARGYYNTSMEDIAEAVGLRKPTLYWYVSRKEEILYIIHDRIVDNLTERHLARVNTGLSNAEMLKAAMHDLLAQIPEFPGYISAFHETYRELNGDMQAQIKVKRDRYFHMIIDVIQQGMDDGEFRQGDAKSLSLAFFGMSNWVYRWYDPNGPLSLDQIADRFWDILMNGVACNRDSGTGEAAQ